MREKKDSYVGSEIHGESGFWTPELLKKLNFFNYQRGNSDAAQSIYVESREEAQIAYQKRKLALEKLKQAMKTGNYLDIVRS